MTFQERYLWPSHARLLSKIVRVVKVPQAISRPNSKYHWVVPTYKREVNGIVRKATVTSGIQLVLGITVNEGGLCYFNPAVRTGAALKLQCSVRDAGFSDVEQLVNLELYGLQWI